ncbi:D3 protein [Bacillus phage SWEP1]|nr:D3 protein [Bacillus phage SWEP1]
MATERRDSSGALIFVPSDSELRTGRAMQNIEEKSEALDKSLAEVEKMKAQLAELITQYGGKGIE